MDFMDIVYKYEISEAIKLIVESVNNRSWVIELREADAIKSREILAETLDPLARDLNG